MLSIFKNVSISNSDLLQNSFQNKEIDLDLYAINNDVYIYNKVVSDLKDNLVISDYNLNCKPINNIRINTNGIYKYKESSDVKSIVCLQIKKFDNLNYIIPNMLLLDNEYLNSINRNIELDNFFEFLNSTKNKDDLLTNFFNITSI